MNLPKITCLPGTEEATQRAFDCIEQGDAKGLTKAMDAGADRDARDGQGWGLLMNAWDKFSGSDDLLTTLLHKGVHPDFRHPKEKNQTLLHWTAAAGSDNEPRHDYRVTLACLLYAGADLYAKDAQEEVPLEMTNSADHEDFLETAQTLWEDIRKALPEKQSWSAQALRKSFANIVMKQMRHAARKVEFYERGNAWQGFGYATLDDAKFDIYWNFLLAIQPAGKRKMRISFDEAQDKEVWFRQKAAELAEQITTPRIALRLGSVMIRREIFSPDRWRGNEEEALAGIAEQPPWFQQEIYASRVLLEAALERKRLLELTPLRAWQERLGTGAAGQGMKTSI